MKLRESAESSDTRALKVELHLRRPRLVEGDLARDALPLCVAAGGRRGLLVWIRGVTYVDNCLFDILDTDFGGV